MTRQAQGVAEAGGSRPSPWPEERPFALALSHDVDRVAKRIQFLYYPPLLLLRGRWHALRLHLASLRAVLRGDDPFWSFERIMQLEDSLGVRSTLFFLEESGKPEIWGPRTWKLFAGRYSVRNPRVAQAMRELHAGGWEIGLHGSYYSFRDDNLLRTEKQTIEDVVGAPVVGTRQHYLNLDIPETWFIQAGIGLQYDSTLGYTKQIGFRWGSSRPFYPKDPRTGKEIPILQIPMTIMDAPFMRHANQSTALAALIEKAAEENGVLTINFHNQYFNEYEHRTWMEAYRQIIVTCQQMGAWVAPMRDIAARWLQATPAPG